MSRDELLANWFEHGLIVWSTKAKCGCEWTRKAKKLVPGPVRTILSLIANRRFRLALFEVKRISQYGFDEKGFYRGKS